VAPLPPPVIERPPEAADAVAVVDAEDEDDPEGFYVRPSLRPGALSEAPFLTPSLHPTALGGPPFPTASAMNDGPMSVRTVGSAFADPAAAPRFRLSAAGLPLKWAAVIAITAVLSFAAGLLVASGPVEVKVGDDRRPPAATARTDPATKPADTSAPGSPSQAAVRPAATTEPTTTVAPSDTAARDDSTAPDATSAPTAEPSAVAAVDVDGSDLAPHQGYLVVRCPERPDAHVYVLGHRMGAVDEPLSVSCGLINVRLGNRPLTTWYGRGHAVQVECQSLTDVSLSGGEAMHPGAQQTAAPPAATKTPSTHRYWVPSSL
jgi:hypothetical protein